MTAPAESFCKYIEASLLDREHVTHLYIQAKEADEFFYWSKSSDKPVLKLKSLFPSLEKVTIEDDYLLQTQIDALIKQLPPVAIRWAFHGYLDGRHGKG